MTIHTDHPFLGGEREAARQLRARLGGRVTLWTAGTLGTHEVAGLTVSSIMVASGGPWRVLALVGPDTDLLDVLTATGRAVVGLLDTSHRQVAQAFAYLAPAPGGPFTTATFESTDWGPRLSSAMTWAGVRLESATPVGHSVLVTCVIDHVEIADDPAPLHHARGVYRTLG